MGDLESGVKWWIRYVVVPVIGGGGIVAIILALLTHTTPQSNPKPVKDSAPQSQSMANEPAASNPGMAPPDTSSTAAQSPSSSLKKAAPDANGVSLASSEKSKQVEGQAVGKTPVLLRCDANCAITIDGAPAGSLKETDAKFLMLATGEHLFEVSAPGTSVTWRKVLALHGTDQIIVTAELKPLLVADSAQWLLGKWSRKEPNVGYGNYICARDNQRSAQLTAYLQNNRIVGHVEATLHVEFPNAKYEDICEEDRRTTPNYELSFDFEVIDISGQSARIRLTSDIYCDATCGKQSCAENCQRITKLLREDKWKLTATSDKGLVVDVGTSVGGSGAYYH